MNLRLLLNEHALYTECLINGHVTEARRWALSARDRLAAQRDHLAFVVHPRTGDTRGLPVIGIHAAVASHLDDHRDRIDAVRAVTSDSPFWAAGSLRARST